MNNEIDPTRDHIVSKIAIKSNAAKKLEDSAESLDTQIAIYENAIQNTQRKLDAQREKKAQMEQSRDRYVEDLRNRESEIEHMEEILSRYDESTVEGEALGEILNRKLDEDTAEFDADTWTPGTTGKVMKEDEEYQKARARKLYLLDLREACKSDVNKIMVSRGEVSVYNVKGREGV